jgi:hypothetical protein
MAPPAAPSGQKAQPASTQSARRHDGAGTAAEASPCRTGGSLHHVGSKPWPPEHHRVAAQTKHDLRATADPRPTLGVGAGGESRWGGQAPRSGRRGAHQQLNPLFAESRRNGRNARGAPSQENGLATLGGDALEGVAFRAVCACPRALQEACEWRAGLSPKLVLARPTATSSGARAASRDGLI